ncbi:hypothetical protein [Ornithobacterium rhinotracheale]|uniref:hypothetical protein n=1 Tax=Ornithobacterium rhinotracheale TaxID=28251 RepID=UPI004036072E
MKKILSLYTILGLTLLNAQVGFQTLNPEKSAMLDIKTDGEKKTVTIPRINLNNRKDKSAIHQKKPAHGLMIYNKNAALEHGKGIYWWDNNKQIWIPIINQKNIEKYKDLAQYYVKNSEEIIDLTHSEFVGEIPYNGDNKLDETWAHVKGLDMKFNITEEKNVSRISFTGTIGWSRHVTTGPTQDISAGFGVFVDKKLVSGKADVIFLRNYCGYYTYYITAIVENLEKGPHTLQFAVQKRTKSSEDEDNGFMIGGGDVLFSSPGGYPTQCKLINSYEAQPSATLYIIQEPKK